jgi:hypothetical protein
MSRFSEEKSSWTNICPQRHFEKQCCSYKRKIQAISFGFKSNISPPAGRKRENVKTDIFKAYFYLSGEGRQYFHISCT